MGDKVARMISLITTLRLIRHISEKRVLEKTNEEINVRIQWPPH